MQGGGYIPAVVSLLIFVGILFLAYYASRLIGTGALKRASGTHIKLIDMMPLGQEKAVAAIRVGDRYFLIGIANSGITNLAELDSDALPEAEELSGQLPSRFSECFAKQRRDDA